MVDYSEDLPWFPMDARRWLVGTAGMTKPEKGVFIDLLCYQWTNGPLSSTPNRLPIECADEWEYIKSKFIENGANTIVNKKLHLIRLEKENLLDKQRKGGEKGARIRYGSPSRIAIGSKSKSKKIDSESELRDRVIKSFHAICQSLPTIRKLSKKRLSILNARLKEYPEEQFWVDYFIKVEQSDFLAGRHDSWRSNFDWLINENNMNKVLEGNYVNKRAGNIMDAARELSQEMNND